MTVGRGLLFCLLAPCAVPGPVIAQPAPLVAEETRPSLLGAARLATLDPARRSAWSAYITESRRLRDADTAAMHLELRSLTLARMTKAPERAPEFDYGSRDDAWFVGDSARRLVEGVLSFQTPSGGWSKRTDMWTPRARGMSYSADSDGWHYIPTLDNGATMAQLTFLLRASATRRDARIGESFHRGVALLVAAQQPNGCWPQNYPLEGGYHDAITFNDDATIRVLVLLDTIARSRAAIVTDAERALARERAARGVQCLVATQAVSAGKRTVWGQQHDPLSLAIVPARSYELVGLSGRESAAITSYLMSLPSPDAGVVRAVRAAAAFLRANAISGYAYDARDGLRASTGGTLLWARLYEIETHRPIFSNRDGVTLYDWNKLTDRRTGYAWFGTEPAAALKTYDTWSRHHE